MQQSQSSRTRLTRDTERKMIGGVCAGIARRYGYDVTVVRVLAVLLTLVWGAGLVLYIALWIIMPADAGDARDHGMSLQRPGTAEWPSASAGASSPQADQPRMGAPGAMPAGSDAEDLAERARRAAEDFAIAARSAAEAVRVAAEQLGDVARSATAAGRQTWEQQRAERERTSPPAGTAQSPGGPPPTTPSPSSGVGAAHATPPPPPGTVEATPPPFETTPPPGPDDARPD